MISKTDKIYIAGHKGLVGSAIWKNLESKGYENLIGKTHQELDLTNQQQVKEFFDKERPEIVILAAAFVGGIMANSLYRADFIMRNMQIQCNIISESYNHNVKKLLFLGSTCIYPKNANQPMSENELLTSELEYTNEPYAIAKIAGLKMCESYNLQYGTNYIAVMPTNLYGPNDNFDLENSHVLPAMIRKMHLAKLLMEKNYDGIKKDINNLPLKHDLSYYGIYDNALSLWGTGKPTREFLWSEDMADACIYILENIDFKDVININNYSNSGEAIPALGNIRNCHINIGSGEEITIAELAYKIKNIVGYHGTLTFDSSKPDGIMRKLTDVSKLHSLGWRHTVNLDDGIKQLYEWYKKSIE